MTREEFSRYVETQYDALYRFVKSRIANAQDAEDILQKTLMRLLLICQSINPQRPDGFFFTALRNAIVDHLRHVGRRPPTCELPEQIPESAPEGVPLDDAAAEERGREILRQALRGLSARERQAFASYWEARGDRAAALEELKLSQGSKEEKYRVYDGPLYHARRKLGLALLPHWEVLADVGYFRLWAMVAELLHQAPGGV